MSRQKEYKKLFESLTENAMKTLHISRRQAELRVKAIEESDIIERFGKLGPESPIFQIAVDAAMSISQPENANQ